MSLRSASLTEGPVGPTLARLTGPMVVGMVGMVAFNLADTFFVGRLGTAQLAALSFTFPVVFTLAGLSLGLGMGAAAVISRAIGQGDPERVQRLTTDSLTLSSLVVGILVLIGFATIEPLFRLLGAQGEMLDLIRSYMRIWYPGAVFVTVPMVGNSAIRATGDTRTPALIMLVAVGVNVVLDPLLIFGLGPFPRLGLAGAAIATVIARACTFTASLWVLGRRYRMLCRAWAGLHCHLQNWARILYIGLPSGLTNVIVPVGIGVVTRLLAQHGPEQVAGFGVASRIETFVLTVIMALGSVLSPFIGQNWGARRMDRVRQGIRVSHRFSLAWGLGAALVLLPSARHLGGLFNPDPRVVDTVALYLWIVPLSYGLRGAFRLATSALSVLHRPLHAAALSLLYVFGLYIPLAYLGSRLWGPVGIFAAAALANVLSGLAAYGMLRRVLQREERVRP